MGESKNELLEKLDEVVAYLAKYGVTRFEMRDPVTGYARKMGSAALYDYLRNPMATIARANCMTVNELYQELIRRVS